MRRIVWTRRLSKLLAFALLIAATCVGLGIWQIARLHQKQQFNARVRASLAGPPRSLAALLPPGVDPDAVRYSRAGATGTYDVAHEVVLYGRTLHGRAGNHLLTPLVTPDGSAVIVDRGWVPLNVTSPATAGTAPPTGPVTVVGVLLRSEGDVPGSVGGSTPQTEFAKIDLARLQAQLPYRIEPVYLLLQSQTPSQLSRYPIPAPLAKLSEGPHLGYAIQWFTFAAIAAIGFVVLALREGRQEPTPEEVTS
jgi:surfeit locus 1 family protein